MKQKLLAASAAIGMSAAGAAQAECGDVTLTEMNWASSVVVTHVSKFLMEQGYGCTVTLVPSSTVPALTSVAETDEPDILTEIWTIGTPSFDELAEVGKISALTDVLLDGGLEGWYVPAYVVEANPEAGTLEGILANPDLIGNRFHNCPQGWACQRANGAKAQAFGLIDAGIEIFEHGSAETLATSIAAAYDAKEPWFGYYWEPTSVLGKYPMIKIDLGAIDVAIHACDVDPECADGRGTNKSGYPPSPVKTVVTTSFADENRDVTELMKNVQFTNEVMGGLLAWQEDNNASGEETAVYFLTNFKDVWGGWLNDDAREKLSAVLH